MYKYFKLSEFDSPDRPGSGELMEHEVVQALDIARRHIRLSHDHLVGIP